MKHEVMELFELSNGCRCTKLIEIWIIIWKLNDDACYSCITLWKLSTTPTGCHSKRAVIIRERTQISRNERFICYKTPKLSVSTVP